MRFLGRKRQKKNKGKGKGNKISRFALWTVIRPSVTDSQQKKINLIAKARSSISIEPGEEGLFHAEGFGGFD
jgi:hypothetical protein